MERDSVTEALEDVGATVLANACGPCIGQVGCRSAYMPSLANLVPVEAKRETKRRKWLVEVLFIDYC